MWMQGRWQGPEAYHSPIHLNCPSSRPVHHTIGHVACTHDWHIPARCPGKMLGRETKRKKMEMLAKADWRHLRKKASSVHVDRLLLGDPTIKLLSESHINLFLIFKITVNLLDCLLSIHFLSSFHEKETWFCPGLHTNIPEEDAD